MKKQPQLRGEEADTEKLYLPKRSDKIDTFIEDKFPARAPCTVHIGVICEITFVWNIHKEICHLIYLSVLLFMPVVPEISSAEYTYTGKLDYPVNVHNGSLLRVLKFPATNYIFGVI